MILAACDEDLLGKKIEEDTFVLDLSSDFFNGTKLSDIEFLKLAKNAYMTNAVGKKVIELLLENAYITKTSLRYVKKIPHTQILMEN